MSGYGRFAWFYDRLTDNVEYDKIASVINGYVERFGGRKGILLDLACGTGSLCERFAGMGYDVIGVDGSDEMLNAALDKKCESGLPIQYLCQDMTELDMYGTVDVTVCTLDSINHLSDIKAVRKAFERVSLFAYPDGMFIFDVNTLYKHREVLADNVFVYEPDGLFCVWQNQYDPADGSVDIYLDFFEENGQGGYGRFQESFTERAYPCEAVRRELEQSGFEILGEFDGYSESPPNEKTERLVYVTKKCR
ncbi:class I SAM-dependent methyltransferase [Ruminococcus sp. Marseille-P6503]|uniref:class I SAM-dependent DNA methyltransferase n=1 Tax=Ruminococcus sp. Marseille-P6503 TaxID=2364796 RepID=UPI000F52592D|nr:class I SAM-dependent methyltransferase [Ruminococcus sp. Marseille-P6503]